MCINYIYYYEVLFYLFIYLFIYLYLTLFHFYKLQYYYYLNEEQHVNDVWWGGFRTTSAGVPGVHKSTTPKATTK